MRNDGDVIGPIDSHRPKNLAWPETVSWSYSRTFRARLRFGQFQSAHRFGGCLRYSASMTQAAFSSSAGSISTST